MVTPGCAAAGYARLGHQLEGKPWSAFSTYLNFNGTTEEAFLFYAKVFGTKFVAPIFRLGDGPPMEPELPEEAKRLVMNVQLPILAGHVIMGTDIVESMGNALTCTADSQESASAEARLRRPPRPIVW